MPQSPPAFVTPSALRWARESIGYELEEAAARIGVSAEKLAAAERGDAHLTLRQAEKAAIGSGSAQLNGLVPRSYSAEAWISTTR